VQVYALHVRRRFPVRAPEPRRELAVWGYLGHRSLPSRSRTDWILGFSRSSTMIQPCGLKVLRQQPSHAVSLDQALPLTRIYWMLDPDLVLFTVDVWWGCNMTAPQQDHGAEREDQRSRLPVPDLDRPVDQSSAASVPNAPLSPAMLLGLQRAVGNRAVAALVAQRQATATAAPNS
jgi:hypothetical protein